MFDSLEKITFWITDRCNLRCKYCPVKKSTKTISFSDAKKLIDILIKSNRKRIYIAFSGGEPLIEHKLIKRIIKYANKETIHKKKRISYRVITNGTFLNADILSMIKEYDLQVTVSVDGSRRTHNRNRVFKNGKGSYDCVKKNIRRILDTKSEVDLALVFDIYSKSIVQDLDNLITLGAKNISLDLNIYHYNRGYDKNTYDGFIKKIAGWYIKFFEKNKKLPPVLRLNRLLARSYDYEQFGIVTRKSFCKFGAGEYFCIDENSKVYPCFFYKNKKEFSFGSAKNFDTAKYNMFRVMNLSFCRDFKKCENCRANKICDKNICPGINLFTTGNSFTDDFTLCRSALLFFDVSNKVWTRLKNDKKFLWLIKKEPREKIII